MTEDKKTAEKKQNKLTHSEKISLALQEVEKAKNRLIKLTEMRILEIGKLAEKYNLLDLENGIFEDAFKKIKADLKK